MESAIAGRLMEISCELYVYLLGCQDCRWLRKIPEIEKAIISPRKK
jgi:hypothetical protein